MADDPNRDILPVKENSCPETCRSIIDPRERHIVCKLDRYQLEDRYLRLLDEATNLKKSYHCQEDKIKRLATKLMRLSLNPRACVSLDACDDKDRITALELENSKLKNKLCVLRNQLLSHTMRSSSPMRSRYRTRPSSALVSCRSESGRIKSPSCQCIVQSRNDDADVHSYLVKIEELEGQKKELTNRVTQLEKELESYMVNLQKDQVVENIEYIRVWRQMKQLNEKLITAQNTNDSLNQQISELKKLLEDTAKNNQEITTALMAERKRMAEIDGQILKAKDSHLTLREKDEQIRDLMNEMKILQQHNSELITLSTKYGKVELENVELKRKVTEQLKDQQSLKTAFNAEQANIVALQAANEQLLKKLQDLQKNMDTLTVQLTTIQKQSEKKGTSELPSKAAQTSTELTESKTTYANGIPSPRKLCPKSTERCKKCCETYDKILQLEKAVNTVRQGTKPLDKYIQTDFLPFIKSAGVCISTQTEQTVSSPRKGSTLKFHGVVERKEATPTERSSLSREKMLKLLDQAQISTPLEVAGGAGRTEVEIKDLAQTHRQVVNLEKLLFGDSAC